MAVLFLSKTIVFWFKAKNTQFGEARVARDQIFIQKRSFYQMGDSDSLQNRENAIVLGRTEIERQVLKRAGAHGVKEILVFENAGVYGDFDLPTSVQYGNI